MEPPGASHTRLVFFVPVASNSEVISVMRSHNATNTSSLADHLQPLPGSSLGATAAGCCSMRLMSHPHLCPWREMWSGGACSRLVLIPADEQHGHKHTTGTVTTSWWQAALHAAQVSVRVQQAPASWCVWIWEAGTPCQG